MSQPSLFDSLPGDDPDLVRAFRAFHRATPQVYRAFRRYALEAHQAGAKRLGAKAVWERMRWDFRVTTRTADYKLNNNFTAFYARVFLAQHPECGALFETRKSVADRGVA